MAKLGEGLTIFPCSLNISQYTDVFIIGTTGSTGTGNYQFNGPTGVAVDTSGRIYVADTNNNRIQLFNSTGGYLTTITHQFSGPVNTAIDASGNVYVADGNNNRIQKFDSSFTWLANYGNGTASSAPGLFNYPNGAAVDSSGNLYVADLSNNRIQKFSSNRTWLASWGANNGSGSFGSGPGEFNNPAQVAVGQSDTIYVADYGNNRIQKLTSNGTFINSWCDKDGDLAGLLPAMHACQSLTSPSQYEGPRSMALAHLMVHMALELTTPTICMLLIRGMIAL